MIIAQRRTRRRQQLFLVFTLVLVLAYSRQLLSSPTAGQDFRAFYAAAIVTAHGGDPYDWDALGRTEQATYNAPAHLRAGDPRYYDFLPFPEGPWLALILQPLTEIPWQAAYPVFATAMLVAIAASSWLILTLLGFADRRRWLVLVAVVLSPITFFNVFQGQATALVLLGFAAAWYLAATDRPWLAGVALSLVWIKPNLGIALPVVLALLEPEHRLKLLLAFAATSVAAFGVAALAMPGVLGHWAGELASHWRSAQGVQPDVASLHSFYYPALSGPIKTLALCIVLLGGVLYALWALRRVTGARERGLTVLLLWFAFLPYVHSFDAVLLLPLLAVLLGSDLRGWQDPRTEVALWTFTIVPFAYYLGLHVGVFNGFTAIPLAALLVAWHTAVISRSPQPHRQAVAA